MIIIRYNNRNIKELGHNYCIYNINIKELGHNYCSYILYY